MIQSDDFQNYRVRTTFLTVLCILTFVGSGYGVIMSIVSYMGADTTSHAISTVRLNHGDSPKISRNPASDSLRKRRKEPPVFVQKLINDMKTSMTPQVLRKNAVGNLVSSLLCLAGALLMWYSKWKGFLFYVAGTILGIATPFYFYGNTFLGVTNAIVPAFFGVLFIIFYAMNLKEMKSDYY